MASHQLVSLVCSKFQVLRRAGEGDDVADVGHPRDGHQEALEPEAEASVRHGAEPPQVEIPPVAVTIHARFLHALFESIEAFFTLTAADELSHARHQQSHGGHGAVVIVEPHLKGFDGFGVVVHNDRLLQVLFGQVAFVFRLQVRPVGDGELEGFPRAL